MMHPYPSPGDGVLGLVSWGRSLGAGILGWEIWGGSLGVGVLLLEFWVHSPTWHTLGLIPE